MTTKRVQYRAANGTTSEARWPIEVEPTRRAIFRGDEYQLAGIADGLIVYRQVPT